MKDAKRIKVSSMIVFAYMPFLSKIIGYMFKNSVLKLFCLIT